MKRALSMLSLSLVFSAIAVSAHAEVITFNDVGYPVYNGSAYYNPIYQPGYLYPFGGSNTLYLRGYSDGMLRTSGFTFSGQHFHTLDRPAIHGNNAFGGAPDDGSVYLNAETARPITLTATDGRPFSLLGFDAAECFVNVQVAQQDNYLTATTILVTGTRLDGSPERFFLFGWPKRRCRRQSGFPDFSYDIRLV